jgi:hypothetical protein
MTCVSIGLSVTEYYGLLGYDAGGEGAVWLVQAMCYKLEASGFDSQCGHWNFSLT